MLYYIKNTMIHRYPEAPRCPVKHGNEILRDTVVHGVTKCDYCLHWWPENDTTKRRIEADHRS